MSGPLTPETPSRESMAAIAAWMRSRRGLAPVDATQTNRQGQGIGDMAAIGQMARGVGSMGLQLAPISGEALSAKDAYDQAKQGQYGMASLSALGAIPFVGSIGRDVGKVAKTLAELEEGWKAAGIAADVYRGRDGAITLSRIVVPKEARGAGLGTKAMQDLADLADAEGAQLRLTPSTVFGATSVDRLKSFYKRFGFVENKGRAKDFTTREGMYRNPTKP